ncbi:MAG: CopG family transcriptional regulator [Chloroflexi bacterium]|nr:CopG family transcriptional regulator [Chloroflexota bacterium]
MSSPEEQRDAFGKQQFNVYLPPELVRELKHAAIDDQHSLSRYVEIIFRDFLDRKKNKEEPK